MMFIRVCIGSSCHLRGSQAIIDLLQKAIEENGLSDLVVLTGSFCLGKCHPKGVTVSVDDVVFEGINPENFREFFEKHILLPLQNA
ncbi:MAG: (2Fe-2S) ferredoxin domain-containing protein [Ruminococcaceae bacterium]|nr:(2Fe-2S) ferredoxin domain-containing protein [Oscillospiraceae bacterium]